MWTPLLTSAGKAGKGTSSEELAGEEGELQGSQARASGMVS